VRSLLESLNALGIATVLMDVHDACRAIRLSVDPEFTDANWKPYLPGDKLPVRETKHFAGDISDIFWPPLPSQLIPRNGENLTLRTARIGDRIFGATFIDLFPKELASFGVLFGRVSSTQIPWRISFLIESDGQRTLGLKPTIAAILSFAHAFNRLI